jgi:ribosomal protein S24E
MFTVESYYCSIIPHLNVKSHNRSYTASNNEVRGIIVEPVDINIESTVIIQIFQKKQDYTKKYNVKVLKKRHIASDKLRQEIEDSYTHVRLLMRWIIVEYWIAQTFYHQLIMGRTNFDIYDSIPMGETVSILE